MIESSYLDLFSQLPTAVPGAEAGFGDVDALDRPSDLLLCLDASSPRPDHEVVLRPDDTVLLYTDGLVERRDSPLEHGLARLRQALSTLAALPLDQLCDEIIARIVPPDADDDIALVAVRTYPEDQLRPAQAGPGRLPPAFQPPDGSDSSHAR